MAGRKISLGDGGIVSGASTSLYSGRYGDVNINFSLPISDWTVGPAGGWENPKFSPTDIDLVNLNFKFLGFGGGINATKLRDSGMTITVDASAVFGGEIKLVAPNFNPLDWDLVPNGYASLETGGSVDGLGMGIGAAGGVVFDDGKVTARGYIDFALVGVNGSAFLGEYDRGQNLEYRGPGIPNRIPTFPHENSDRSVTHRYRDPVTGLSARTTVIENETTHEQVAVTTILEGDGNIYAAGNVGPGQEMNGPEQIANENFLKITTNESLRVNSDLLPALAGTLPPPVIPFWWAILYGKTAYSNALSLISMSSSNIHNGGFGQLSHSGPTGLGWVGKFLNGFGAGVDATVGRALGGVNGWLDNTLGFDSPYRSPADGPSYWDADHVNRNDHDNDGYDDDTGLNDFGGTKADSIASGGLYPILLDLDDNGIQITSLDRSTVFWDGGDGLEHRAAWAGAGDGVLFYDPDNTGEISERRQYVFTDWDRAAGSDMAALASVFDGDVRGDKNAFCIH